MTRRALFLAPLAVAGAIAGSSLGLVWASPSVTTLAPPNTQPACELVGGGWLCVFPTPGYPARVVVEAYEDGGARAFAVENGR
jgi:hypothetical protein